MATREAYRRLTREYKKLSLNPPPYIIAKPLDSNILEWHYIITGPPDSPYHNGEYHGVLIFPPQYPYLPPAIKMITPNGRFRTNYRLCLSISDYHPKTWSSAWGVSTILTGLLSFMLEDTRTVGSIETSIEDKIEFSKKSKEYNRNDPVFKGKMIFFNI
ncbi:UBC-like protein [Anaeromyces robustus]|uniref:UBC-like protein n=1 Tax=Anaeromyces robustus TaxID=1754192 RepID=A0A1Y1WWK7_9FUNG|nr:UBC-like protein [Anaeromyces robustus]|eukprot:ORX77941.1 UBC-like protein [Anaeromyces robustus]